MDKTNVMRLLDAIGISYQSHFYNPGDDLSGVHIAKLLGQNPGCVYKTLVTVGKSRQHYVFIIPVAANLNLKKAAAAVNEKSIEMIPQKELLPLTGYVHGGCSPIGMKKFFPTVLDETAVLYDSIFFSGGKIGAQVEMTVEDLQKIIPLALTDLID